MFCPLLNQLHTQTLGVYNSRLPLLDTCSKLPGTLTVLAVLDPVHPCTINPFYHPFHPDVTHVRRDTRPSPAFLYESWARPGCEATEIVRGGWGCSRYGPWINIGQTSSRCGLNLFHVAALTGNKKTFEGENFHKCWGFVAICESVNHIFHQFVKVFCYTVSKFVLNRTGNQLCQIGGVDIIQHHSNIANWENQHHTYDLAPEKKPNTNDSSSRSVFILTKNSQWSSCCGC